MATLKLNPGRCVVAGALVSSNFAIGPCSDNAHSEVGAYEQMIEPEPSVALPSMSEISETSLDYKLKLSC